MTFCACSTCLPLDEKTKDQSQIPGYDRLQTRRSSMAKRPLEKSLSPAHTALLLGGDVTSGSTRARTTAAVCSRRAPPASTPSSPTPLAFRTDMRRLWLRQATPACHVRKRMSESAVSAGTTTVRTTSRPPASVSGVSSGSRAVRGVRVVCCVRRSLGISTSVQNSVVDNRECCFPGLLRMRVSHSTRPHVFFGEHLRHNACAWTTVSRPGSRTL